MELKEIQSLLPNHYTCRDISGKGTSIYCESDGGGFPEQEDWEIFLGRLKNRFKSRFSEIWHKTKFRHLRFIIYLNDSKL